MNKGFTLIELLVVVLIIGILAAIALPQYTKAVERSRMAEAVQVLGDLATAQSIFYMQHNAFANDLGDLNQRGDVTVPGPEEGGSWSLAVGRADGSQMMTRQGGMYDGAALRLTVRADGSILKECLPNRHEEFCGMAETAGYGPEAQAAGGTNGRLIAELADALIFEKVELIVERKDEYKKKISEKDIEVLQQR